MHFTIIKVITLIYLISFILKLLYLSYNPN